MPRRLAGCALPAHRVALATASAAPPSRSAVVDMRTTTRAAARPLLALSAVLFGLAVVGAAPAAAQTLTQKPLPAGCIGEAPCTVGIETYMTQSVAVSPDGRHAYAVAWRTER